MVKTKQIKEVSKEKQNNVLNVNKKHNIKFFSILDLIKHYKETKNNDK